MLKLQPQRIPGRSAFDNRIQTYPRLPFLFHQLPEKLDGILTPLTYYVNRVNVFTLYLIGIIHHIHHEKDLFSRHSADLPVRFSIHIPGAGCHLLLYSPGAADIPESMSPGVLSKARTRIRQRFFANGDTAGSRCPSRNMEN